MRGIWEWCKKEGVFICLGGRAQLIAPSSSSESDIVEPRV